MTSGTPVTRHHPEGSKESIGPDRPAAIVGSSHPTMSSPGGGGKKQYTNILPAAAAASSGSSSGSSGFPGHTQAPELPPKRQKRVGAGRSACDACRLRKSAVRIPPYPLSSCSFPRAVVQSETTRQEVICASSLAQYSYRERATVPAPCPGLCTNTFQGFWRAAGMLTGAASFVDPQALWLPQPGLSSMGAWPDGEMVRGKRS